MSNQIFTLAASAAICVVLSGIAQAAPIEQLPASVITETGKATQIYYRYHYRNHPRVHYHHYRYY